MTGERRPRLRDQFLAAIAEAPALMGVLNLTPDASTDSGPAYEPEAAVGRAKVMAAEGAAIIDVGGESTRSGPATLTAEEELARIAPALEALGAELDAPVAIDTKKAAVARAAARLGASVVRDVSGLQHDSGMAEAVAESGLAVVVIHNREAADASLDILDEVERFFERSLSLAARASVPYSRILLDPGIGFGKTSGQDLACIWNLDRFRRFGRPILVDVSRKSFIGRIVGDVQHHVLGTLAAHAIALTRGASVIRVHDVRENRIALDLFKRLSAAAKPSAAAAGTRDGRTSVIFSLGGNVGDKAHALRRALNALGGEPGIELVAASRFYRTPPWGKTDQDAFVNACALALTSLRPEALLDRVKRLEVELGRVPAERWGPRVIDIDIIAYDDAVLTTERLTLPHPGLFERAFVLVPLAEIAPDRTIGGRRVGDAAASLGAEAEGIVPLD